MSLGEMKKKISKGLYNSWSVECGEEMSINIEDMVEKFEDQVVIASFKMILSKKYKLHFLLPKKKCKLHWWFIYVYALILL